METLFTILMVTLVLIVFFIMFCATFSHGGLKDQIYYKKIDSAYRPANTDTSDINTSLPASINTSKQSGGDRIADAIVQAMRDNKAEVEVTIVDRRTGESKVISGSYESIR
ncbi:TPA: hypothetical protein ACPZQD_001050 [Yersinia enterocolitica]